MMNEGLNKLRQKLLRVKSAPESAVRDKAIWLLELDIKELTAQRQLQIIPLARTIFKTYEKNGSMRVILKSGVLVDNRIEYGSHPVDHLRNAQREAMYLAELVIYSH